MEKKLITLVFVALLAGLGGGYGLGYVIYQPQIQNLQNGLDNVNQRLKTIAPNFFANASFHLVYSVKWDKEANTTGGDFTTPSFLLMGKIVKIRWTMLGEQWASYVKIWLTFANGTKYAMRSSSGFVGSFDGIIDIDQPNTEYYLDISIGDGTTYYIIGVNDYY